MLGTRRRQDHTSSSFSSCTTASSHTRWSDISCGSTFSPPLLSSHRPIIRSSRRILIPSVPAAWSPASQRSPQIALRDFCLPRHEPRPPADVLNRSPLSSCSPSLAKFSRTTVAQHVSISTSTTTLPSPINPNAFLHPTMTYLTVNGLRPHHHHRCRHHTR